MTLLLLWGIGGLLIWGGNKVFQAGEFHYSLDSYSGDRIRAERRGEIRTEKVVLTGSDAKWHGIGTMAAGGTLVFWGLVVFWNCLGPLAMEKDWTPMHALVTLISLAGCVTMVIGFFPPWHIPQWPSCDALYVVLLAFCFIGTIRDEKKVKKMVGVILPPLFMAGILLSNVWIGITGGLVAGVFIGLLLAVHIVLLIPQARAQFWDVDPAKFNKRERSPARNEGG
ncbi:MAG: hypothetical protein U0903_22580 [Planctomycetales bacterium]